METFDIYHDITTRTGGDIYIGVVGPVRTGKSTFIKKFMEQLVIPNIEDESRRERVIDELPQSADGRTIMTTEPKFVPDGGVMVGFGDGLSANVRLIDSVGYIVDDADGYMEGENDRYVSTPWSEEKMTLKEAGEMGTRKVIVDHSTVGIVVTCDGSICGIDRESYIPSEERVISELKNLGKPFIIVLNSIHPESEQTIALRDELADKYGANVVLMSVANMQELDTHTILENLLLEFPIRNIELEIPSFMQGLGSDNHIIVDIVSNIMDKVANMSKMRDYISVPSIECEYIKSIGIDNVDFGNGVITYDIKAVDNLFYDVISEETGVRIDSDLALTEYIKRLAVAETFYNKMHTAMDEADAMGYSIVMPTMDEVTIGDAEVRKKSGKCQLSLRASGTSLHIMKVDVNADICPVMGTEEQCNEMKSYIDEETKTKSIMDVSIFNKPISKMIEDEMLGRADEVTADTRAKMVKTMSRIVNEGKGGVLCVLI